MNIFFLALGILVGHLFTLGVQQGKWKEALSTGFGAGGIALLLGWLFGI